MKKYWRPKSGVKQVRLCKNCAHHGHDAGTISTRFTVLRDRHLCRATVKKTEHPVYGQQETGEVLCITRNAKGKCGKYKDKANPYMFQWYDLSSMSHPNCRCDVTPLSDIVPTPVPAWALWRRIKRLWIVSGKTE